MVLQIGDKAPGFILKDAFEKEISLSDFKGKRVIIYFYPKDNTPGCTKEACNFKDNWDIPVSYTHLTLPTIDRV